MNIYSKILISTLPLVFCLLLATVGTAYHFSRTALTELAETWLDTRLSEAMRTVALQHDNLRQYDLDEIPASIAKAKLDAAVALGAIRVGDMGLIFAVDRQGRVSMHPNATMVGEDVSQTSWFQSLKPGRSRLTYMTPTGRNLAMADYFAPWEWYILASDPEREVYGVADRMRPYLIGFGIVGFAAMAAALMLLTHRFTGPLRLLTDGAEKIGKGDLDTRITIHSRDEFGRLAGVFNHMTGKLQETLTELQHREAHFRSLIEHASDLIAILDATGCIIYLSPSVKRILGYSQDAIIGRKAFDFVHPDDRDHAQALFDKQLTSETIGSFAELRFRYEDGSWRTLETTSNNLLNHPAVQGFVVNARDITKRKIAETALQRSHDQLEDRVAERTAALFKTNARLRQEIGEREQISREKDKLKDQLVQAQKMEAIGTLAGGIAHNFNNLLMSVQGNVELMTLDTEPCHAHRRYLKSIRDCIASGTRLTQQLLGFARMGKYEVKPTEINALAKNSAEMFGKARQELRIVETYQEDVWTVEVDRGQIEQVLLNLFINAWQAMPDGGTLYLETANKILDAQQVSTYGTDPGKYVKITITDTGTGMDSATMARIFDPFFTTKAMGRGTGLGLASTYGIVVNHGGFIDVSSKKGHGTTFDIYLKATDAQRVEASPTPVLNREGHETILLVDDDPMILDVGRAMLATLGYKVLTAQGGSEALAVYGEHRDRIRLVILDMIMPDMGGGKTYDQLKAANSQIKVLLSSGYSLDGQASEILSRGCNGFIQKPFDLQLLSEKVRVVLDSPF